MIRLDTLEKVGVVSSATFPYVPGLLSFREIPSLLEAWQQLKTEPNVVMFDGHDSLPPDWDCPARVNPVYVSPGHLIDLLTAIELTLRCSTTYRIPEPTRRVHNLVNALRRASAKFQ